MNNLISEERTVINSNYVKSIIVTEKNIFHINSYFNNTEMLTDLLLEIATDNIRKHKKLVEPSVL